MVHQLSREKPPAYDSEQNTVQLSWPGGRLQLEGHGMMPAIRAKPSTP
jgi:hypothetical protein